MLWHLINDTVNESLSQCPPALFLRPLTELSELSVAFYQAKHNSNCSADIENLAAFFVVVFVLLTELSRQNETFHQAVRHPEKNTTHWQEWVLIYLFFLLAKKGRNLNKGFMKRTKAKPRTNTERFGPHFFLLASQLPFTVPTRTSQGARQARPERDANLSWHIKLRLARITELSATNGQAERLSSRAEGPHQIRLPAGACDLGGVHHVVAYWRDR